MTSPITSVLTDLEKAFFEYDRNSPSNIVAVAELSKTVGAETLQEAIRLTCAIHPYLNCAFEKRETGPVLVQKNPGSEPACEIETVKNPNWIELAESLLNHPFNLTKTPLVKAVLADVSEHEQALLVAVPHLVVDGLTAVQLAKTILDYAGLLGEGRSVPAENFPLIRPSSDFFRKDATSQPQIMAGDWESEKIAVQSTIPADQPQTLRESSKRQINSMIFPLRLTLDESNEISDRCRDRGMTTNALFSSALCFAMRDHFAEQEKLRETPWVKISTAIDLKWMTVPEKIEARQLGMWAGRCVLYTKADQSSDGVAFCKTFHSALFRYLRRHAFAYSDLLVNGQVRPQAPFIPHVKITNLGDLDETGFRSDYGAFRLRNLHVVTTFHRDWIDDLGFALIPTVFEKRINLLFLYSTPGWTKETAGRFAQQVKDYLFSIFR